MVFWYYYLSPIETKTNFYFKTKPTNHLKLLFAIENSFATENENVSNFL